MEKNIESLPFIKDKPMIVLSVVNGFLAFATVMVVFVRLRSNDFKVPVQYVVHDGSVLQTSSWFTLYSLALFAILATGSTIFFAMKLHKSNRLFAGGVLAVYVVVALFSLLVTYALLELVSKV